MLSVTAYMSAESWRRKGKMTDRRAAGMRAFKKKNDPLVLSFQNKQTSIRGSPSLPAAESRNGTEKVQSRNRGSSVLNTSSASRRLPASFR